MAEQQVSLLLSHGFLMRHTMSTDGYLFSMPNAGAAVRSIAGSVGVCKLRFRVVSGE